MTVRWSSLSGLAEAGLRMFDQVGGLLDSSLDSTIRLGVTGLRRSGKTVFITSLVENLLKDAPLPFLDVVVDNRFQAARLVPHPDLSIPRFDFERHLATLTDAEPRWPEETRGVSQIRVAIRYLPGSTVRRAVAPLATLNLDIVDYPGEWLLDLPLLTVGFAEWSRRTLDLARRSPRAELAGPWLEWLNNVSAMSPAGEEEAKTGARLYTDYLLACRRSSFTLSLVQPGRFVEPGDLKGAPLLTFCPIPMPIDVPVPRGSLGELMQERFEAYKTSVVGNFFVKHFSRLDRQIVLVDVLGALNAGPAGMSDMQAALAASLEGFRHGRQNWLSRMFGSRVDRVLFAATKVDHIASNQHNNLRTLLDRLVSDARRNIRFEGATVETMAIAAVKCTETVVTEHQGRKLWCIQGRPVGRDAPTVLFPGEIPDGLEIFPSGVEKPYNFLDFRPPPGVGRDGRGAPNIRIDQALNFLLGDYLA
ncbi:YcjX family protein [Azospirillaceae bacterium]